jgi:hypothetical protein
MIETASASAKTRPSHLSDGEEVYGPLGSRSPAGPGTVAALIGSRSVLLPADLKLPEGQVFVVRIGNEHFARGAEI